MVRLAIYDDAEQLKQLNNEFNGLGDTTLEKIQESLLHNQQEFVVVEEINKTRREINALGGMLTNIIAMQSTIIQDLKSGNIRTKKWGKIAENDDSILLGINNPNFVGPTTMQLDKKVLEDWLSKIGDRKIPIYKGEIDPKYSNVSNVYTLAVPAVNKRIKEEREGEGKKPVLDYLR